MNLDFAYNKLIRLKLYTKFRCSSGSHGNLFWFVIRQSFKCRSVWQKQPLITKFYVVYAKGVIARYLVSGPSLCDQRRIKYETSHIETLFLSVQRNCDIHINPLSLDLFSAKDMIDNDSSSYLLLSISIPIYDYLLLWCIMYCLAWGFVWFCSSRMFVIWNTQNFDLTIMRQKW